MTRFLSLAAAVIAFGTWTASAQAQYEPIDRSSESLLALTTQANQIVQQGLRNSAEYQRLQSTTWTLYRSADRIQSWISGRKNYDRVHSELTRMDESFASVQTLLQSTNRGFGGGVSLQAVASLDQTLRQAQAVAHSMRAQLGVPVVPSYGTGYSPYGGQLNFQQPIYQPRPIFQPQPIYQRYSPSPYQGLYGRSHGHSEYFYRR